MRRLSIETLLPLYADMHMVHRDCMIWRMRCLAHRLVESGWEDIVNHLPNREALTLATLLPQHMHNTIVYAVREVATEAERDLIDSILAPEPAHV